MAKKLKFKIKGMHCNSCVVLIEGKLKDLSGVINAKINYETGMGVVVYEEGALQESKIYEAVKSAGDYQVEKIESEIGSECKLNSAEKNESQPLADSKDKLSNSPKMMFILGLFVAFSVFSFILNIVLFNKVSASNFSGNTNAKTAQEQNLPDNNIQAQPQIPALPTARTIVQFDITKANHVRGDFNAPITLVEFSDFECPYCERHYPTLNKVLSEYKGKVRLVYKHFPLSFHPNGQKAAEASECADEQGKFWAYHDKLFENQPAGYSLDKFKQWSKDLGLNSKKFNDCLDSGKYAQKVKDDSQEGVAKGVQGTPATFVNGQLVSGAVPYESLKQIIDGLLSQ